MKPGRKKKLPDDLHIHTLQFAVDTIEQCKRRARKVAAKYNKEHTLNDFIREAVKIHLGRKM